MLRDITWAHGQKDIRLCWHVAPNHKFDARRSSEKEFIAFLICYMTLCNHVTNKLWHFIDNGSALEPTTLSNLVAISLAEVEIQRFLSHVITWSRAQSVTSLDEWWPFTKNLYLAKFDSYRPQEICHMISSSHGIAGWCNFAGCGLSA